MDSMKETIYTRMLNAASELKKESGPAACARLIGVSDQVLTNWKKRGVPGEQVLRIAEKIGCDPFWLWDGRGDMVMGRINLSPETLKFAKEFEKLSAEKRAAYRVLLDQNDQHEETFVPLTTKHKNSYNQ